MKVENVGTKSHTLVKLALVFFISLLTFAIGIFVGKNFSDAKHKEALLEPQNQKAVAHHQDEHAPAGEANGELSDAEISKLAEEFVDEESPVTIEKKADTHGEDAAHAEDHADAKAPAAAAAKAQERTTASVNEKEVKKAAVKNDKLSDVANALAEDKVPKLAPPKKEPNIAKTLPEEVASDTVGKYTLQIGSFPSEGEAKKVSEDLKNKGYAAFYLPATIKGKTVYRVSIGLFGTQKEAVDYKKQLSDTKYGTESFVQKISK